MLGALNSYASTKDLTPTGKPKAYLNYIVLDNQFQSAASGAYLVGTADSLVILGATGIVVPKSGYLYIWVSNETPNWDVFFDNLSVKTYSGPLVEENHYYPLGLTMAGISDKALKTQYVQNKFRYNGKELQNQEFSDGTGLEGYDFGARMQDPQLGRWWGIDPLADKNRKWSPYAYANDNPIRFIDPDGMDVTTFTGEEAVQAFKQYKQEHGGKSKSVDDPDDVSPQLEDKGETNINGGSVLGPGKGTNAWDLNGDGWSGKDFLVIFDGIAKPTPIETFDQPVYGN